VDELSVWMAFGFTPEDADHPSTGFAEAHATMEGAANALLRFGEETGVDINDNPDFFWIEKFVVFSDSEDTHGAV
jgi:hypothetical protein